MRARFKGPLPKRAICPAVPSPDSVVQILQGPWYTQVKALLFNYAEADLSYSYVSHANKGIHQKQLICIPQSRHDKFAFPSHQTVLISLIILRHSDRRFHQLILSEPTVAEALMTAVIGNWLDIQVEKSPAWNQGPGTAWTLTNPRWCGIETMERHWYHCKWKQSILCSILERGVMRESTPMHILIRIAIEVCVNSIPAATEDL